MTRRVAPPLAAAALAACALVGAGSACAAAAAAGTREIVLRDAAAVGTDTVTLGDVAVLAAPEAGRLAALPLAPAPRVGQALLLARARVQAALPVGWHVAGAAAVRVERLGQDVAAASLCEVALEGVRARLEAAARGAQAQLACLDARVPPLRVPAGVLALQADTPVFELVDGAQAVRVAVRIDGRLERAVSVPLRLDLDIARWCAAAPLAEGTALAAESFGRCRRPVRHAQELALDDQPLPPGRLRRALHAGEALAAADVSLPQEALAGDPVTVRVRNGAFELESAGVLVQSARIGARVHVRTGAATAPVVGTLIDRRVVELE